MTTQSATRGQGGAAQNAKIVVSRFAPSPTGRLHLGHAYSALQAHDFARKRGGRFLLRIEDIDPGRCREEFVEGICEDLAWLGLAWDGEVLRQSQRLPRYAEALDRLKALGLVYPCFCTRTDIAREIAASASAPHGPDGPHYPGTCRSLSEQEREQRMPTEPHAWRLDMGKAIAQTTFPPHGFVGRGTAEGGGGDSSAPPIDPSSDSFTRRREDAKELDYDGKEPVFASSRLRVNHSSPERGGGPRSGGGGPSRGTAPLTWTNDGEEILAAPEVFGDVVLARKDAPTSYHLAVVVDDDAQRITDIVRGADLYASTHIHRLLQALLDLPTPAYHHHPLLADAAGKRLAKRTHAPTLADLRAAGADPRRLSENLRRGILPAEFQLQKA
jgi:glutamyl-Q tRNA(Asp) synthetase